MIHPAWVSSGEWNADRLQYSQASPAIRKACIEEMRMMIVKAQGQGRPVNMHETIQTLGITVLQLGAEVQLAHHDKLRKRGKTKRKDEADGEEAEEE